MKVMSGLDARFLYSSTPTAHMHTMKVVVVDVSNSPQGNELDQLGSLVEARLPRMPMLRRRVLPVLGGLANPMIIDDPDFDIARHISVASLDPPGDQIQLDRLIGEIAGVPLPTDRPLWNLTIVEGLSGGRIAFVVKLHHALADGVASVAMMENAFIVDDSEALIEEFRPEPVPRRGVRYRAAAESAAHAFGTIPRVARETREGMRRLRDVREHEQVPPTRPFSGPRTRFNVALSADRTFASIGLPLSDVLTVKDAAGVKVNDVFLSLVSGAIRRYLGRLSELPERSLITSVPMATRTSLQRLGGNHVDNLFIRLYTDVENPVERVRLIRESTLSARRAREAFGTELFERRSGLVPAGFHKIGPRLWGLTGLSDHLRPPLNLISSCVRGPHQPLEVEGAVVSSLLSCGPILEGIGLNVTAWSYVDTLYVSILGCSASLPDPETLAEDLRCELGEWVATL